MNTHQNSRVNTLIIGAGRSGTTTLWSYMKEHEEVCFSYIKEVPFFSLTEQFSKGEKYYHSFFRNCEGAPVIASADTYLLMDHKAISRVHKYNPDMKLVVMLREPVARAYSSYTYSVNFGHHKAYASFLDSMEEERRISQEPDIVRRNNVGHFYGSLYHEHLSQWRKVFPREQMLLLKTSDLKDHPEQFSGELPSFLNLKPFEGEPGWVNAAAVPKNKVVEKLFMDRETLPRKLVRKLVPRQVKHWIMSSGLIGKLHEANRKPQATPPLSEEEENLARPFFMNDLMQLKEDFGIEF